MRNNRMYLTIIICFLLLAPFSPSSHVDGLENDNTTTLTQNTCYGYVIPLPQSSIIQNNPQIHYSTLNLINDLLNQDISVYWINSTMNVLAKRNLTAPAEHLTIKPGTFIVPFSTNNEINNILNVIITDYFVLHELDKNIEPVCLYFLLEQLTLNSCYQLEKPKIALYFGNGVIARSMNWYITTLSKSGFLNLEILTDQDVITDLNNKEYSVLIWPGGRYSFDLKSNISFNTRYLKQYEIKKFVSNGGGYIGSCYGAYAASSGIKLFPFYLLYQFPDLPTLGLFQGLQDSYIALAMPCYFNISVDEKAHPVLFGANNQIDGSLLSGGCVFTKLGKHTHSLASVKEIDYTKWLENFQERDDLNPLVKKIIENWINFTIGKTIWTTSEYGQGKIVTFGDHPEKGDIHLQRITHNALFYVTSKQINHISINVPISLDEIVAIQEKTKNLILPENMSDFFDESFNKLETYNQIIHDIKYKTDEISRLISSSVGSGIMDQEFASKIYSSYLWNFRETFQRHLDFFNMSKKEEKITSNLINIAHILLLLEEQNLSYDLKITPFETNLSHDLTNINLTLSKIVHDLSSLKFEINNYQHSKSQNDLIIQLFDHTLFKSKDIEKLCPKIFFNSKKFLRDLWYYYESTIC